MHAAYDPELFRQQAHAIVDRLADHLRDVSALPVMPNVPPRDNVAAWASDFRGGLDAVELFTRVIRESTHLHHPGFVGHQVTAPLPLTAIAELVAGFLNNGAAVYEMGPATTAMERVVSSFLCRRLGYAEGEAIFTSGGSLGNLTALLAARACKGPGVVLTSEEAHYSTARAARIMGLELVTVPADERFRMRVDALAARHAELTAQGKAVMAVVASACSTSTGAFDPLPAIADLCEARGLWLHVDGAHGASFVLSPKHRHLACGIARADSVVWDAHKMMLCPALVTAVLFKRAADSFAAFHGTSAAYLLDDGPRMDGALRTVECTKRMLILGLYAALTVHGEDVLAAYLDTIVDLAHDFARTLARTPGFEVLPPECNIVCFRYGDGDQDRLRQAILDDGQFYVVKTRLRGRTYLRTTIINPRTTAADLDRLIARVREL